MRALPTLSALLFAAALAACATPQENPNYQFSSTYTQGSSQMTTQSAAYSVPSAAPDSYILQATPAPDLYSRVGQDCITLGTCSPEGIGSAANAPVVSRPWQSPTEELFAGGETTPGFRALEGSLAGDGKMMEEMTAQAPNTTPDAGLRAPLTTPRPTPRITAGPTDPRADDEVSTLTISGPIVAAGALGGTRTRALMHRVEVGDTVYGLANRYCTSVEAIRSMNSLDGSFAIALGADMKIPGNCN